MFSKWNFFLPAVVFLVLISTVVPRNDVYLEHNLASVCDRDGKQVQVPLGKQPAILTLDLSPATPLTCHLALLAPDNFGFYVYIEHLKINKTTDCKNNFLQFGRYGVSICHVYLALNHLVFISQGFCFHLQPEK